MAPSTWRATIRLMAFALTSSYRPSSRSQLSKVEPMFFFFSPWPFFPPDREIDILFGRLLRLLHETVQEHHAVALAFATTRRTLRSREGR
jgi:hypothetical protein